MRDEYKYNKEQWISKMDEFIENFEFDITLKMLLESFLVSYDVTLHNERLLEAEETMYKILYMTEDLIIKNHCL